MTAPRVLLIDDTAADRALAVRQLRRRFDALEVVEAADEAALDAALARPPVDLVITDHRLRWTTGLQVVRAVKARWPDTPVIMFTSSGNEEVAVEAMKAGADDYVVKSGRPALAAAADGALARAEARRRAVAAEREREAVVAELRRALGARDAFLQVASHELKNPLNALVLHVEALVRDPEVAAASPRVRDRLERTRGQVRRLVQLIDALLDLSMLGAGRLELRPEPLDLVAVTRGLLERLEPELRRAGCAVRLEAQARIEGTWDPVRLEQVLLNLVSNAMKFGAGRPIEVGVVVDDAGDARVAIADRGPGIALEAQERIFERFERAVSERNYAGMGLGLWIARELARAMGGRIEVRSAPGAGARFEVVLPRRPGARAGVRDAG